MINYQSLHFETYFETNDLNNRKFGIMLYLLYVTPPPPHCIQKDCSQIEVKNILYRFIN